MRSFLETAKLVVTFFVGFTDGIEFPVALTQRMEYLDTARQDFYDLGVDLGQYIGRLALSIPDRRRT